MRSGIEYDEHHLVVAGAAAAHLLVRRVGGRARGVADGGDVHPGQAPERLLRAPEAAEAELCLLHALGERRLDSATVDEARVRGRDWFGSSRQRLGDARDLHRLAEQAHGIRLAAACGHSKFPACVAQHGRGLLPGPFHATAYGEAPTFRSTRSMSRRNRSVNSAFVIRRRWINAPGFPARGELPPRRPESGNRPARGREFAPVPSSRSRPESRGTVRESERSRGRAACLVR